MQAKSKELLAESASLKAEAQKKAADDGRDNAEGVNRTLAAAAELEDKAAQADLESSALALEAEGGIKARADKRTQEKANAIMESARRSSRETIMNCRRCSRAKSES